MRICSNLIRKYPFSCLFLAVIWILCFCTPPHTPLDNVTLIDKWVHIIMYAGTCTTIWIEYLRSHKTVDRARLFVWAWLAPVLMSGLIELLQAGAERRLHQLRVVEAAVAGHLVGDERRLSERLVLA